MNISAAKHPASVRQDRTAWVYAGLFPYLADMFDLLDQSVVFKMTENEIPCWLVQWPRPLLWSEQRRQRCQFLHPWAPFWANLPPSMTTLGHVALHRIGTTCLFADPSLNLAVCLSYSLRHETIHNELSWGKLPKQRGAPGVLFFMRVSGTPFGEIHLNLWVMAATSNDQLVKDTRTTWPICIISSVT